LGDELNKSVALHDEVVRLQRDIQERFALAGQLQAELAAAETARDIGIASAASCKEQLAQLQRDLDAAKQQFAFELQQIKADAQVDLDSRLAVVEAQHAKTLLTFKMESQTALTAAHQVLFRVLWPKHFELFFRF
jgi:hypothetical protein